MEKWAVLNWAAWAASALIAALIIVDFIKVEKARLAKRGREDGR